VKPGSTGKGAHFLKRSLIMKRKSLLVLSVLALGLSAGSIGNALAELTASGEIVHTSPYPMDGQGPFNLPALESYAERQARIGESPAVWGVSKREVQPHDPFPFGGGYIDD
jgi:hypothetical protein